MRIRRETRYSSRRRGSLFSSLLRFRLFFFFFPTLPFCTPGKTALERFLWEKWVTNIFPGWKLSKEARTWGIFIKIITTLPGSRVRVCLALLRKEMWITRGLLFFDALTFYFFFLSSFFFFFLRATSFPCRPIKRPLVKPVLTRWKNGSRVISVIRDSSFSFCISTYFVEWRKRYFVIYLRIGID